MANALIKDPPIVTVIPGVVDIPGHPGAPGRPGQEEHYEDVLYVYPNFFGVPLNPRDVQLRETYIFPVPMTLWTYKPLYLRATGAYANIDVMMMATGEQFWTYRLHYKHVDEVPPIDPVDDHYTGDTVVTDMRLGWDKSAFSITSRAAPYRAQFRIPDKVVGAMCGVAYIDAIDGQWKLDGFKMEHGVLSALLQGSPHRTGLAHASGALLEVTMNAQQQYWKVDGVVVLAAVPPSLNPNTVDSPVPVFLGGMLYASDDSIYDPVLELLPMGTVAFMPPAVHGGILYKYGEISSAYMTVTGGVGARVTFEPMAVLGGHVDAIGTLVFRNMAVAGWAAEIGPPVVSAGAVSFLPMDLEGAAGRGVGVIIMRAMDVRGGLMRQGAVSFPAPFLLGFGGFVTSVDAGAFGDLISAASTAAVRVTDAAMPTTLALTVTLNPARVAVGSALSTSLANGTLSVQALLGALAYSSAAAGSATPPFEDPGNVWVVNDDTGAISTYVGFPFNSYARIGDAYYGLKSDGLYLLEGDTDDSAVIRASLDFGQLDFGTTAFKRVTDVYVGMTSTNKLLLKVTADGKSYVYQQQRSSTVSAAQRFVPGKGLQGMVLAFELYNLDNTDFELSSIEFTAIPLSRRI